MINANKLPGLYVVFDGIIGCGKGEQISQLKRRLPLEFPDLEVVFTYEPGGTPEADELRQVLKHRQLVPHEEVELFAKSREITLKKVVRPALAEGKLVISDRSVTTSLAYQGEGRKVGMKEVWEANVSAVGDTLPDVLIYLNTDRETSIRRSKGDVPDKFDAESVKFWDRTVVGFEKMMEMIGELSPQTRIIRIDDLDDGLGIEGTRVAIEEQFFPLLRSWKKEGAIVRERQE